MSTATPDRTPDEVTPIEAYEGVRARVDGILRDRADELTGRHVPACPEWTVHDVVAHLAGGCHDSVGGDTRGAPGASWTERHVRRHAARTLVDVLDEWAVDTGRLRELVGPRGGSTQMTMDALTHEYDLRVALGLPWPVDDREVLVALSFLVPRFCYSVLYRGLPPLAVQAGPWGWAPEDGADVAWLRSEPAEAMRALTGRRTPEQVAAMHWTADPRPWLGAFRWGPFLPPRSPVEPAAA